MSDEASDDDVKPDVGGVGRGAAMPRDRTTGKKCLRVVHNRYPDSKPTVFFEYPDYCSMSRDLGTSTESGMELVLPRIHRRALYLG
jgi:hypothetical protein